MLPIAGTSSVAHLEENIAAVTLELSDEEVAALDSAADDGQAAPIISGPLRL